jgi:acyl carrier protein
MDSLDLVEMVMLVEEIFGTDIPSNDAEEFGGPREMVNWLELHLQNRRPNQQAITLLRKLSQRSRHS